MSNKSIKDILKKINKKKLPKRKSSTRIPIANKPNFVHKSKKVYDRKKQKKEIDYE